MELCSVYGLLYNFLRIYTLVLFAYALISWFPAMRRYRAADYLAMLVEPVLAPVRRIIPPVAGLDLSFLIVIILIQWVNGAIVARNMCYF